MSNRYVLDTNTIISAALFKQSPARQAFEKAIATGFTLQSLDTIAELTDVFRREKFNRYLNEAVRIKFLTDFLQEIILVAISSIITDCRDPKDNKFLSLPLMAKQLVLLLVTTIYWH